LYGNFRCECETGYELRNDARSCEDIDECALGRVCAGEFFFWWTL